MIAAGARLDAARAGAAERGVGAGPAARIAAPRAAAGVIFGVEIQLEAELALELGDDPLVLGIEAGERIRAGWAGGGGRLRHGRGVSMCLGRLVV